MNGPPPPPLPPLLQAAPALVMPGPHFKQSLGAMLPLVPGAKMWVDGSTEPNGVQTLSCPLSLKTSGMPFEIPTSAGDGAVWA